VEVGEVMPAGATEHVAADARGDEPEAALHVRCSM